MSKQDTQLQDYKSTTCDDCGETVVLDRHEKQGLTLKCQCERRSVKVKRAIPFEWMD